MNGPSPMSPAVWVDRQKSEDAISEMDDSFATLYDQKHSDNTVHLWLDRSDNQAGSMPLPPAPKSSLRAPN
jgi:hypothetical protein